MMTGRTFEYNWDDIVKLIYNHAGLESETEQRTRGDMWCQGSFAPPKIPKDICIRVTVYDKPASERFDNTGGPFFICWSVMV